MNVIGEYSESSPFTSYDDGYEKFITGRLNNLKSQGNYRDFVSLERKAGHYPKAIWHNEDGEVEVTVWCSNDYMGMSENKLIIDASVKAAKRYGVGAGGTRNISGTHYIHNLLELELAKFHKKESALLFTSGFVANEAILSTLSGSLPNCVVFSDEKNHASMIAGLRNSGVEKRIFKHNSMDSLRKLLSEVEYSRPKIIAVESIYSMDGSVCDLSAVVDLAKKFNALTFVDEVHAIGLYGDQGAGIAERDGVLDQIDIVQGTLAKAVGVMGGYMASSKNMVDFIRSFSHGFIFTSALSPILAQAALESLRILKISNEKRNLLQRNVQYLKNLLREDGIPFLPGDSHIIPIIIGCPRRVKKISMNLLSRHKIYVQPINYPTVSKGGERLRLSPSPYHTPEHSRNLVDALFLELCENE